MIEYSERDGALSFEVQVVPRASRSEITGTHDSALRVRIAAPPVDGAANKELLRLIAKAFGVSKSSVEITSGLNSKRKTVLVREASRERLHELCGET
ncbi:MAG TPA: DUF167 domain-containing protein [Pyrinomonadaceae bacterium]|nr:DUF167 domain-containing protein [Pyrinomonadaceae bacterium]